MERQPAGRRVPRYVSIAEDVEGQIRRGALVVGERAPSLRSQSRRMAASITTIQLAYDLLEDRGFLSPRARSGYFVQHPSSIAVPEPRSSTTPGIAARVGVTDLLHSVIESFARTRLPQLGAATPSPVLLPTARLSLLFRRVARHDPDLSERYEYPPGSARLRAALARRVRASGGAAHEDDFVVTVGAMEALNLSLRAVAGPGDAVAIESPTYFGILQLIGSLSMKAHEIPTHPRHGMDLDVLETVFRRRQVKACITVPNGHNPLGYVLGDDRKRKLAALAARHRIPVIEDDVYGELIHDNSRPTLVKSFDRDGWVLHCSSISKTLAPGFRVGWVNTERFRDRVMRLKYVSTVATPSLQQAVLAQFLETGAFDRHLDRLRRTLRANVESISNAVSEHFPRGTRLTRPAGGYVLWVELPRGVRGLDIYREADERGISVAPGEVFSSEGRFRNHLRLSCGHPCTAELMEAVAELGRICHAASKRRGRRTAA